jgi:molybdate transport system substrate-binding protein
MSRALTLISSMATQKLLAELLNDFQALTGQTLQAEAVGGVDAAKRVAAGEVFDAVVLAAPAIGELERQACVQAGSRVDLVNSGVAIAIREGRPAPAVTSESEVRDAVLAAGRLSFSTGPSGAHLQRLFERWGISELVRDRIVQAPAGIPVGRLLAEGRADLGFQQYSELLNVPGICILGPLPEQIQVMTTFSGAVCAASSEPARVRALLTWLASPATAAAKRRHGMEAAS